MPDATPWFRHTFEGPDDMPAHVKAVLVGESLTCRCAGRLDLGVWQGVYLASTATRRPPSVIATLWGEGSSEATGTTRRD